MLIVTLINFQEATFNAVKKKNKVAYNPVSNANSRFNASVTNNYKP